MSELEQLIKHWLVTDHLNNAELGAKIRNWYWSNNTPGKDE